MSVEQNLAAIWTENSLNKMIVQENDSGKSYTTDGTLFSGWRHTSFMNTVLNRVYLMECGIERNSLMSIHNGDDVYSTNKDIKSIQRILELSEEKGLRAQTTKMNIGTIAEFLRVDGKAATPTSSQYLTRACATACHARIESEASITLRASIDATIERSTAVVERGGNKKLMLRIERRQLARLAEIYDAHISTIDRYLTTHPAQGGRDITAAFSQYRIVTRLVKPPDDVAKLLAVSLEPGSNDYINYVAKRYHVKLTNVDRRGIRRLNETLAKSTLTTLEVVPEMRKLAAYYVACYKVHNTPLLNAHMSKIRLLNDYNVMVSHKSVTKFLNFIKKQENKSEMISNLI